MEKPLDHHGAFVFNGTQCQIRVVRPGDLETLRVWKNDNRHAFHHQELITRDQQTRWFAAFAEDPTQQLFVCEIERELIACVGFRIITASRVELFNLICGSPAYRGRGVTTRFFECLRDTLADKGYREIALEVLKSNPEAAAWYARRGFGPQDEGDTFLRMLLTT